MSKLDELIKELCPDGVEYKRFDEVCSLHARIGWQRLTRAEYRNQGEYLLITGTDFNSDYTINYDTCVFVDKERFEQDKKIQLQDGDVLITKDGTLGKVAQVVNLPKPATLNGGVFVVRSIDGQLLQRYILHFLMSGKFRKEVFQKKTGSTISHLTQGLFSRIKIPVPPLEVQREIVKILDNFTELTAELIAELTARKKQYEYYRNRLLTFDRNVVPLIPLGDLCNISRGASPRPIAQFITSDEDGVNWIKIGDASPDSKFIFHTSEKITREGAKKSHFVKCGDFILSNSMSFGRPYILKVDGCIHDGWLALSDFQNDLVPDYLYHILCSTYVQNEFKRRASRGGSIKNLNADIVKAIRIPVPDLSIQRRISDVLDNFDKVCNDLHIGLPAEIEARKKQYEFYRDSLLTFLEKGGSILTDRQTDRQN